MIPIIIPAKGGSNRLPNKNMALVNGRPMLDYAIDQALESKLADAVYVSTDSDEIAKHAESRGIKIIRRDSSLGGDTPIIDVYRHALKQMNDSSISFLVGLQPDHPDREISVDQAIEAFVNAGDDCDMLYSTEADGKKNGAHYIISRHFWETDECRNKIGIVDNCTNVHYEQDLKKAEERLKTINTRMICDS